MLQRLDKRKDRVEISPEQLSDASDQAEISFKLKISLLIYFLILIVFNNKYLSLYKCIPLTALIFAIVYIIHRYRNL